MNEDNKILLEELFQRYGTPSQEAEIHVRGYFLKAESITKTDFIRHEDENALHLIQELQHKIDQLNAYRLSLAERYNHLETDPAVPVVRLSRQRDYYRKKVFYHLCTFRRFIETGVEVEESRRTYPGTERSQAIKDFQSYTKTHPGITAEMNIEKHRWER